MGALLGRHKARPYGRARAGESRRQVCAADVHQGLAAHRFVPDTQHFEPGSGFPRACVGHVKYAGRDQAKLLGLFLMAEQVRNVNFF